MQQIIATMGAAWGWAAGSGMAPLATIKWDSLLSSLVYSLLGIVLFGVAYIVLELVTPFSIRRELEEKQNVAVGILMGSAVLAIAIIIHGAIASP